MLTALNFYLYLYIILYLIVMEYNLEKLITKANNFAQKNNWKEVRNTLLNYLHLLNNGKITPNEKLLFLLLNSCDYFNSFDNNKDEYEYIENLKISINIYQNLIKYLLPNEPILYNNLGLLYIENSQLDLAILMHKKASELAKNNPDFYFNLANVYLQNFDYVLAEKNYLKTIKLNPNDASACFNLAMIYANFLSPMNLENTFYYLQKALQIDQNNIKYSIAIDNFKNLEYRRKNLSSTYKVFSNEIYKLFFHICKADNKSLHKQFDILKNKFNKTINSDKYKQRQTKERAKVLFQPIGRSGSFFLQSLIDGHSQISTLPSVIFMSFFKGDFWEQQLCPKTLFAQNNWQDKLIENFCCYYSLLFHSEGENINQDIKNNEHFLKIPNLEVPDYHYFITQVLGFYPPDEKNSNSNNLNNLSYFGVNKEKFVKYLKQILNDNNIFKNYISREDFFDLIHQAYQYCLNRPLNTNFDFYHIHLPDENELTNCILSYQNVKLLSIIRNPIQSLESWIKMDLNPNYGYNILQRYEMAMDNFINVICPSFSIYNTILPSKVVRLEDLKQNTNTTLKKLMEWFGTEYNNSLLTETFGNNLFNAPSQIKSLKGFQTTNIEQKIGSLLFSPNDIKKIKILVYPLLKKYNYLSEEEQKLFNNIDYFNAQIKWLKMNLDNLFDFEVNIQNELRKNNVLDSEILKIQTSFRSKLQIFINLLQKYQNYPYLAELL